MRYVTVIILLAAVGLGIFFAGRPVTLLEGGDSIAAALSAPYQAFKNTLVAYTGGNASDAEVNVLILGRAGPGWTAGDLTDTILIASISGPEQSADLFSIPRDLLVQSGNYGGKINALWLIGKQEMRGGTVEEQSAAIREAAEEISGIPIDEVIVVDVSATERVVDELGGISINVQEHIIDTKFPTPGGGIERFEIEPGFHVMDGKTAVQYARTRRSREGDFGRIRRQHQVIEAIVSKARGLNLFSDFSTIVGLLEALGEHVQTTLSAEELATMAHLGRSIPFSSVETYALETLMADTDEPLLTGAGFASGLVPRAGFYDYSEIHTVVEQLLND